MKILILLCVLSVSSGCAAIGRVLAGCKDEISAPILDSVNKALGGQRWDGGNALDRLWRALGFIIPCAVAQIARGDSATAALALPVTGPKDLRQQRAQRWLDSRMQRIPK